MPLLWYGFDIGVVFTTSEEEGGHFSFTVLPCLEEQGVNGVRDVSLAKYVTDDRKLIAFTEQETVLIVWCYATFWFMRHEHYKTWQ